MPAAISPSMTPVEHWASRRQRGFGAHKAIGDDVQDALARRRKARRGGRSPQAARQSGAALARTASSAHHHARDHAERGQGVARNPFRKAQRQGGQGGHVGQDLGDALEPLVGPGLAGRLAEGAIPNERRCVFVVRTAPGRKRLARPRRRPARGSRRSDRAPPATAPAQPGRQGPRPVRRLQMVRADCFQADLSRTRTPNQLRGSEAL